MGSGVRMAATSHHSLGGKRTRDGNKDGENEIDDPDHVPYEMRIIYF